MIQLMTDLPDGVIGFTAVGTVTGEDYEQVVIPAVEAGFEKHRHLSLIYHLGEGFEGFDFAAMWDDAKLGLGHLTAWNRVAVVTDVDWIRGSAKAFGFVMPCPMRVFATQDSNKAREWASESTRPHLECELLAERGIAILTPEGRLQATDFERVAARVDSHLAEHTSLNGIMIRAARFPGWEGLNGLISHLRFVRDHHKRVQRVAIVTDETVLAHLPGIARHFVAADVRHFPADEESAALTWLEGE